MFLRKQRRVSRIPARHELDTECLVVMKKTIGKQRREIGTCSTKLLYTVAHTPFCFSSCVGVCSYPPLVTPEFRHHPTDTNTKPTRNLYVYFTCCPDNHDILKPSHTPLGGQELASQLKHLLHVSHTTWPEQPIQPEPSRQPRCTISLRHQKG